MLGLGLTTFGGRALALSACLTPRKNVETKRSTLFFSSVHTVVDGPFYTSFFFEGRCRRFATGRSWGGAVGELVCCPNGGRPAPVSKRAASPQDSGRMGGHWTAGAQPVPGARLDAAPSNRAQTLILHCVSPERDDAQRREQKTTRRRRTRKRSRGRRPPCTADSPLCQPFAPSPHQGPSPAASPSPSPPIISLQIAVIPTLLQSAVPG